MRSIIIFISLLLSFPYSIALYAEQNTPEQDSVMLAYGWKPGLTAKVSLLSERTTTKGNTSVTGKMNGTYKLSTEAHKSGLLINFFDTDVQVTESANNDMQAKIQQFINKISSLSPSYVINNEGELVDVEKLEAMKQAMDDEFTKMFSDAPEEIQAKIRPLIDSLTSKQQLMAQITGDWNRDVAQWVGAEFEKGYDYELEYATQIPLFGNIDIPTKAKFQYNGKVPCNDKQQDSKCVSLSMLTTLDQEALRPAMMNFFKKVGAEIPENFSVQVDTSLELITEPSTLIPHSVKSEKITKSSAIGTQPVSERVEKLLITYDYSANTKK